MPIPSGKTTYYLAFGSAVGVLFSISVSQLLLALAIASLLLSGEKIRIPPVRLPLVLFFLLTVVSMMASPDPLGGMPQIRKFFVFAMLVVIYSSFHSMRQVRALVLAWAGAATLSAGLGLAQFLERRHQALVQHADNYGFFLDGRITGFASHWMTFGGEEMVALLMLASFLLFARDRKWKRIFLPPALLLWATITLGMTRCIFLLGVPLGMIYLLWNRKRALMLVVPAVAAIGLAAAPQAIRQRVVSVVQPHGDVDSNSHRAVCRAAGWEMVKAHPWLGLGPEQVGKQFEKFVPARISRPLPHGWYGHLHNIYLQYAAERGVPALLCLLWFVAGCLANFFRHVNRRSTGPAARFVLHGSIAVILAILAEGLFEYNLGDSEVLTMFLAAVACGYVAVDCTPAAGKMVLRDRAVEGVACGPQSIGA
jgi:putative inorganic carbon (hco3(-)) transporter